MDILIKGLEMPKGDDDVKLIINSDGSVHRIIGWAVSEKKNATAIELPPHGRLVNIAPIVEKLEEMIEQVANQAEKSNWRDGRVESHYTALKSALHLLKDAEVVLEAST